MSRTEELYEVTLKLRVRREVGELPPREWCWDLWAPDDTVVIEVQEVADRPCAFWDSLADCWMEVPPKAGKVRA